MEKEFWKIIKKSGNNCDNINYLRHKIKKTNPELIDNLDTFIKLSKNLIISGMNENDNILESRLCMRTLNYVYDNFFSQPSIGKS